MEKNDFFSITHQNPRPNGVESMAQPVETLDQTLLRKVRGKRRTASPPNASAS
jgi:hypothetical protein